MFGFLSHAPSGVVRTSLIVIFIHSLVQYHYDIAKSNIPIGQNRRVGQTSARGCSIFLGWAYAPKIATLRPYLTRPTSAHGPCRAC